MCLLSRRGFAKVSSGSLSLGAGTWPDNAYVAIASIYITITRVAKTVARTAVAQPGMCRRRTTFSRVPGAPAVGRWRKAGDGAFRR